MADGNTHKRLAESNEQTMRHLLDPNSTGGVASPADHPWIAVIAYFAIFHLIEEVASIENSQNHLQVHDDQVNFLRSRPALAEFAVHYNSLNTLRKYALYRSTANVSFKSENRILGYSDPKQFKSVVLDGWFGTLKNKLLDYRHSLLSVQSQ